MGAAVRGNDPTVPRLRHVLRSRAEEKEREKDSARAWCVRAHLRALHKRRY